MTAILILLPMVGACLGYLLFSKKERAFYFVTLFVTVAEFCVALLFALRGDLPAFRIPLCGSVFSLEYDGFRALYTLVIAFMWMMTTALSLDYFRGHHKLSRYFFFLLMTLGAIMGVFLASDLFTALIFFEIMSFTSFPWVIQEGTDGAVRAANTYLAVAVIGGLVALMGLFLLYAKLGTLRLCDLAAAARACPDRGTVFAAGVCVLFGFGAKAGMFPLHIWLPKAHPVAPAPASALLSGVLTKAGVWGIIVLCAYIFREDPAWGKLILTLGTVTMLLGALKALFSVNLKETLACSSMSQIGFILIGLGGICLLGEENALAARGALLHMLNHSLFKLDLFLCAGVVYMNAHTLDLNDLKGFGRKKPLLHACFLLGAAGIAGIPGLNGYVSKTLLHESIVEAAELYGPVMTVVEWIFLLSGGLTLAYMAKLYVCLFWESPTGKKSVHADAPYMGMLSKAALAGSALLIPVLGSHPSVLMDAIADAGTDFFRSAMPAHAVRYYAPENLKGGLISVAIGLAVYFLVVRGVVRTKDGKYRSLWPKWLDLEDSVYRPLLLKVLPDLFGRVMQLFGNNAVSGRIAKGTMRLSGACAKLFGDNLVLRPVAKGVLRFCHILSHVLHDLTDALVYLLSRTVFRPSRAPVTDSVYSSRIYRFGKRVDDIRVARSEERHGKDRFSHGLVRLRHTVIHTTHNLIDSVSFALLMLCVAICAVLVYIFIIHR